MSGVDVSPTSSQFSVVLLGEGGAAPGEVSSVSFGVEAILQSCRLQSSVALARRQRSAEGTFITVPLALLTLKFSFTICALSLF